MIAGAFASFVNALLLVILDRFQIAPNWKKVIDWKSLIVHNLTLQRMAWGHQA